MLKVRTQKLGGLAILYLQGRIVKGETNELSDAVRSQLNASVIMLDFAQIESVDAKGLGVLLELREFAQTRGIEFRLINVNQLVRQVLALTRLDSVLTVSSRTNGQAGGQVLHSPATPNGHGDRRRFQNSLEKGVEDHESCKSVHTRNR